MSENPGFPQIASELEHLNRDLLAALATGDWPRVASIQELKSARVLDLERAFPGPILETSPERGRLHALLAQEEEVSRRLAEERERIGLHLRSNDTSANLSRRLRASYGIKDPKEPNWEHYS